ncbi:SPARC-related modular calcium-binding protein 2-like isoform X2 [Apostichopus japonicus]|uniref:SPARC-related modular calcium-binding protein 2-like isoform X2 n=1 Tax=Stichopus japonicus TaxID=307972 RepID=UPI003AB4DE85
MRSVNLPWPGLKWMVWPRTLRDACQVAICLVFLFQVVQSSADSLPISPDSTNDPRCLKDCSNARQKTLCGTDDRTYSSNCELKRVKACLGRKTKIKHKGPCVAELSKCEIEKASAQEQMDASSSNVYVAQCNDDGTYSAIQCHFSFGWCWCVNDEGKPLPRTAVRHQRPTCDAEPADVVRPDQNVVPTQAKAPKGGCDQAERRKFNENLRQTFRDDYERSVAGFDNSEGTDGQSADIERKAMERKFAEFDLNRDTFLQKKELATMRRLMRKLIKPKVCVKSFTEHCDLDYDEMIAESEWMFCLGGVDISFRMFLSLTPGEEEATGDSASSREAGLPVLVTRQVPREQPGTVVLSCSVEFQRATAEATRDTGVFIPQCDEDGSYMPVQCHDEAEYCWCAYVDTGRPIPGSSSRRPFKADCDPTATFRTPTARREFKDCPDNNKARFLSKLIDAIYSLNEGNAQSDRQGQPTEESMQVIHAVLWEFNEVDINQNGILETTELDVFSDFVKTVRANNKCKRNFLAYCDSNEDDVISQREWLQCFEVDGAMNIVPATSPRGRNPFSKNAFDRLT